MKTTAIDAKPRPRFLHSGKARLRSEAINALLSSPSVIEAAYRCGVSERTLRRWLSQSDFMEDYRSAQRRLLEAALNTLRGAAVSFAETIRQVAEDPEQPGAIRYAAAARGLEILLKVHGLADMERQLTELEEAAAQLENRA